MPNRDKDAAIEFQIWLINGNKFNTGGFDSIASLNSVLHSARPIDGCFGMDNMMQDWHPTRLVPSHIVAIMDVR